ncbi:hypothetical protein CFI14_10785 [Lactiplantibacillus pentosus]|uniref:ATP-dependent nuclease n=1 Tax=Lactiplantibacillus pentosus TaxID=1589 RepID=UPI000EAAA8ED|nr:AAA family ATPase [Lactiplantibacillus pentosus]AYG38906.1 hypothetical protein CFK27_13630 [Lactiplantibacillus pentosus]AYG41566.1 hypothetical protein CFI14_10785 [Lactiplantibacillus pentosus]MCJ8182206.1 AAA family ATPase [Lactiplantibacillus pentosus]
MVYVKKIKLHNFKKFMDNEFYFDKGLNVVVGQNDSGKSSILQAIDISLNQRGNGDLRNRNEYGTLLNLERKNDFLNSEKKPYTGLPTIEINIFFEEMGNDLKSANFYGAINGNGSADSGVTFKYAFDEQYMLEYEELIAEVDSLEFIPFEFYSANWQTFGGFPYNFKKNPMKSILINTDNSTGDSYKTFTKQLFATLTKQNQNNISLSLKQKIEDFNHDVRKNYNLPNRLEIDSNRFVVQDNLDVVDEDSNMLLRDMGSGTENIIKTNLAMKAESKLVLLEEPENHLSFDLARKQIGQISRLNEENDRQLIVTTHSTLLASKLSINNLKWLNGEGQMVSFKDISDETAMFFQKADNIDVLQVILSKRCILVEGATEYILMEDMVQRVTHDSTNSQRIHVVSMGGNYYKRFKEIVNITKNKVLIVTDNDSSLKRIKESKDSNNEYLHVVMPTDISKFTFEVALFEENESYFDDEWTDSANGSTWKKHGDLNPKLVWILNNKTTAAFKYSNEFISGKMVVPRYISEGLKWLVE